MEPRADDLRQLSAAVADLGAARGDVATAALATYGIRYVLLPDPVDAKLAGILDRTQGLVARTTGATGRTAPRATVRVRPRSKGPM